MKSLPFADVVIVGSGASGTVAAYLLTQAGCRVTMLEAGRRLSARDFAAKEPDYQASNLPFRMWASLLGQHRQANCGAFSRQLHHFFVDDRKSPYRTDKDKPFSWYRGRQVGGRLHAWGRLALRMSEEDFDDWPLGYTDLEPHYDRIERLFGLQGARDGLRSIPDGVTAGTFEPNTVERAFVSAANGADLHLRGVQPRILGQNSGGPPSLLTKAERTGLLDLRTGAIAMSLDMHDDGQRCRGVTYLDEHSGTVRVARGRVVWVCASTIETCRLLLNSQGPQHRTGVGNDEDLVGRYLMDSVKTTRVFSLRQPNLALPRSPSNAYDLAPRHQGFLLAPESTGGASSPPSQRFIVQGWLGRNHFGSEVGGFLMAFGGMKAHADNRVTLDSSGHDAWGLAIPKISCRHSTEDVALARTQDAMLDRLERLVPNRKRSLLTTMLNRLGRRPAPGSAVHEVGGARMGSNRKTSVINPTNQVWRVPNVLVSDGGCFPDCSFHNPTLTIMALTSRTADFVASTLLHDLNATSEGAMEQHQ